MNEINLFIIFFREQLMSSKHPPMRHSKHAFNCEILCIDQLLDEGNDFRAAI